MRALKKEENLHLRISNAEKVKYNDYEKLRFGKSLENVIKPTFIA